MADLLTEMAASSRVRADALRAEPGIEAVMAAARAARPRRIDDPVFALIAEVKLRAPSAGDLALPDDPEAFAVAQAERYARAGATAISVLTEPLRFAGALSHLQAVAASVRVPVMRKDFLVDPLQVWEARAAGASGVLLITRMLDDDLLRQMLVAAAAAELFVLLEAFDADDLARTRAVLDGPGPWAALPVWVGVNTRDLSTLEVRPERLGDLAADLPSGVRAIAESGLTSPADLASAAARGYRGALVGSALMRTADPGAMLAAMRDAAEMMCS